MKTALKEEIYYRGRRITEGTIIPEGIDNITLPLRYTEVRAGITGMLADVKVTQKFYNDYHKNIEAIYVFPLPHESAVNELEIQVGERIIRSEVKERVEARRVYEEAKTEMKHAALLEQERPNIFTISVANIKPGEEILVNMKYHEAIKYEDGEYEFIFPMTVTPRYTDGKDPGTPADKDKISPSVRKADREINIFLDLDAGFPIGEITSPSHRLYIQDKGKTKREIQLAKEGEVPNKDFILRYSSRGEEMEKSFSFHRNNEFKPGSFMFHITPKMDYGPDELVRRELIFVLDRSGSMSYGPMEQAKKALKACMRTLRSGDAFGIITFDTRIEYLSSESLEFNDENLQKGDRFIDATHARGGTDILSAMDRALKMAENKLYLRQIVFLTDGAVGNEHYILKEISKSLGKARVYTFGIGPSVNRYLLDKMAEMGKGTAQYLAVGEDIEDAIQKFSNRTAFPVLTDIKLKWKDLSVADTYPAKIPDLYFGHVLYIVGRFHSAGKGMAVLSCKTRKGDFTEEIEVEFPEISPDKPVIETIWARKRIEDLLDRERENPKEKHEIRDEVIGIAMKYHLMSPYTSLVAVEEREDEDGEIKKKEIPIKIDIPSMLPEGLNEGAFSMTSAPPPPPGGIPSRALSGIMPIPRPVPQAMGAGSTLNTAEKRLRSPLMARKAILSPGSPPPSPAHAPESAAVSPSPFIGIMKKNAQRPLLLKSSYEEKGEAILNFDQSAEEAFSLEEVLHFSDDAAPMAHPPVKAEEGFSLKEKLYFSEDDMDSPLPEKDREIQADVRVMPPAAEEASGPAEPFAGSSPKKEISPEKINLSLKWLVRNQSADGAWSGDIDVNRKVISTSMGLLAFIKQGHTNKTGNYMPQVTKGLNFIQAKTDKLSGLALSLSVMVFLELYNTNPKKKEKMDAEKAVKMLKNNWTENKNELEKYFAAIGARRSINCKLAEEKDFSHMEKWLMEAKEHAVKIPEISDLSGLQSSFLAIISEKEGISGATLSLLENHHINQGQESGCIKIPGINPLDGTATGIFILSWLSEI